MPQTNLLGYSESIINTMMAGRRPSTNQVYNYTWSTLSKWCLPRNIIPEKIRVKDFLGILQSGFEMELSTATIRCQISTVESVLGFPKGTGLSLHPHVKSWPHSPLPINYAKTTKLFFTWTLYLESELLLPLIGGGCSSLLLPQPFPSS